MATINRATTQSFLKKFGPKEIFTFQTFDDNSNRKNTRLIRVLHGTLTQHFDNLARLNGEGAGVFVTVNATDGKGRKVENILHVRANFVDLDGAPLEPVMTHSIPPSIVVESSPGRWHAYWITDDCKLADFKAAQQRLANQFGGDPSVCDLPRVMRLPGFLHQKAEPFVTKIIFPI
jgi:hypothetical protein